MAELLYINFTYKSPCEDIENMMGFNPDGSININYTLVSLRDMLSHNIELINKLLENTNNITNIDPIGYGIVQIDIRSPSSENLINDNVLVKNIQLEEEVNIDTLTLSDEEETNNDRLSMVNNLINQNNSGIILNKNLESNSESDDESSDNIIDDNENMKSIINKYNGIKYKDDSDNSSISDDETTEDDSSNEYYL